jgi:hypothetical protein
MKPANSHDITHGHISVTWAHEYLESWPEFHISVTLYAYVLLPYVGRPNESSFISRVFIVSPQLWAITFLRTDTVT